MIMWKESLATTANLVYSESWGIVMMIIWTRSSLTVCVKEGSRSDTT
jgi:hypothetical protein